MAAMESGSAAGLAAITKYGWIKFASLSAALVGAGMMAIFRPPKTRKEMFTQGLVALGSALLFGNFIANLFLHYIPLLDVAKASLEDLLTFHIAVNGMVGAMSWGLFGGLAHLRDKVESDPVQAVKDVRNLS
jgi:hypothetical protein